MLSRAQTIVKKFSRLYASIKTIRKAKSYSDTILLPQTKIPLRLENKNLIERDKNINNLSAFNELYAWQRGSCKDPQFTLHDGPPYANGAPHMGHAINKILKDTIIRSKIMHGQKVDYIPGWDCHGLPIELKAVSSALNELTPMKIRAKARNFAKQTIGKQKQAFQSWGVIGDWDKAYMTFNNSYIINQMQKFCDLYEKKLVYRDIKPVSWSPSSRTALAEAELEYNAQHKSKAIFVKLKLNYIPEKIPVESNEEVYALIWTTTPWTLPSNQAICFNPKLSYSLVQEPGTSEYLIVATNLVGDLSAKLNAQLHIASTFTGKALHGAKYHHPLNSKVILPFLTGDHASDTKGTGLVHTAPAHGPDDFLIFLNNKLSIISLVDEAGCYTSDAGPALKGLFVLSEGNQAVLDIIKESILHVEDCIHSYPYDWRTKQPVIIRASKQWFIDTNAIKDRAVELLDDVNIIPAINSQIYKSNLIAQVKKRPYWCISRQRTWGVPIPVFYRISTEEPIINRAIINHLSGLLNKHGSDYWWQLPLDVLLPDSLLANLNIPIDDIKKGEDILDIWFDSGLSWSSALEGDQVADMYLEGVDQFTGWFQSSLMTSVALRDKAPYKSIYVHGFVVDEQGLKMSKSLGNVVDPIHIMHGKKGNKAYGIDTLRWWVVCHANSDSMAHISTNVLQASADEVQKVRSVLRFALGTLYDYQLQPQEYSSLPIIDKYLLHLVWNFHKQVTEIYNNYEFSRLSPCVINFLTNPVSALYYIVIKDRLYCDVADSADRKAAQFVLFQIFLAVSRSIAPVIPHLAEELYMHLPQKQKGSIFQNTDFSASDNWHNLKLADLMENVVLSIKRDIHKTAGANTLDLNVKIKMSQPVLTHLKEMQSDLTVASKELVDILQVSRVDVLLDTETQEQKYLVLLEKSSSHMCDRCRRVFSENESELCSRCNSIVNDLKNKTVATS